MQNAHQAAARSAARRTRLNSRHSRGDPHRYPSVSRPLIQPKAPGCVDLLMASWHARCRWRTTLLRHFRPRGRRGVTGPIHRPEPWLLGLGGVCPCQDFASPFVSSRVRWASLGPWAWRRASRSRAPPDVGLLGGLLLARDRLAFRDGRRLSTLAKKERASVRVRAATGAPRRISEQHASGRSQRSAGAVPRLPASSKALDLARDRQNSFCLYLAAATIAISVSSRGAIVLITLGIVNSKTRLPDRASAFVFPPS